MPPQPWKTPSTREIYKNNWMPLHEDVAKLPNGRTTIYGVCEFGECVGIHPFIDDENVIMVRQYRYVHHENHRWEMPTGGISPGGTPEQAARRELMEEGDYRANQLNGSVRITSQKAFVMRRLTSLLGVDWLQRTPRLTTPNFSKEP